jgi:hypothetical protein
VLVDRLEAYPTAVGEHTVCLQPSMLELCPMQKDDVVVRLREMADLLEITDANTFEVLAHRNAAQRLEEWNGDLAETVGRAIASKYGLMIRC